MSAQTTVGVGLVGAGFLARTRVRCWQRVFGVDARVTALVGGNREKAVAFASDNGIEHVARELDELLERSDVDVVDLCVPNRLHRPFAERAAAAKKHVLCTKPMAAYIGQDLDPEAPSADVAGRDRRTMYRLAVEDARAMVAAANEHAVALHYGENWVYAPSIVRASEMIGQARGPILEMRGHESHSGSHSPYSKEWSQTGGGALLRLGAHPIGAMLWLKRLEGLARAGKPIGVASVTASVADLTRTSGFDAEHAKVASGWNGVENWGTAVLAFEDGSRGTVFGSDAMLGGMESKLEVLGADHHFNCNLSPNDLLRGYATEDGAFGDAYVMEKLHGQAGWSTPMPDEDWTSGQQGLCQAVAEAVAAGASSAADGELGLDVTRVVYAAYISAAEGRRVELRELDAD